MSKRFEYNCLFAINEKTNEIEERYDSIKAAVFFNEGYNYNSLKNAISKKITYKGYYWVWQSLER